MQAVLRINPRTANIVVAIALLLAMPFFTVFGALSDRIGRKKIMMSGCLLAVICYYPIYKAMQSAAGNNVVTVQSSKNRVTGAITLSPQSLDASGALVPSPEAVSPNLPMLVFLVFAQVIFVCMVYGPIAAYLVEAFPAKIRYTSLSLPYHIGNGVFGGLLPLIGLTSCAATGNIYAGLWYPMIVASVTSLSGRSSSRRPGMSGSGTKPEAQSPKSPSRLIWKGEHHVGKHASIWSVPPQAVNSSVPLRFISSRGSGFPLPEPGKTIYITSAAGPPLLGVLLTSRAFANAIDPSPSFVLGPISANIA